MDKKTFYTITDVSQILNVSEKTIRRHINSGKLKSQKIGGVHRIEKADLSFFVNLSNSNPSAPSSKSGFPRPSLVPDGDVSRKWANHKQKINLVSPANKRLIDVIRNNFYVLRLERYLIVLF